MALARRRPGDRLPLVRAGRALALTVKAGAIPADADPGPWPKALGHSASVADLARGPAASQNKIATSFFSVCKISVTSDVTGRRGNAPDRTESDRTGRQESTAMGNELAHLPDDDEADDPAEDLSAQQLTALASLTSGSSMAVAAEKARVSVRTLHRWKTTDGAFIAALDAIRSEAADRVRAELRLLVGDAVATVRAVMTDAATPASVRLRAAWRVLENVQAAASESAKAEEDDPFARLLGEPPRLQLKPIVLPAPTAEDIEKWGDIDDDPEPEVPGDADDAPEQSREHSRAKVKKEKGRRRTLRERAAAAPAGPSEPDGAGTTWPPSAPPRVAPGASDDEADVEGDIDLDSPQGRAFEALVAAFRAAARGT